MTEPTRRLPDPIVNADGKLVGKSVLTPETMKTRGAIAIPSSRVIPVILVPGIMGSNLRATTKRDQPQNKELSSGSPAWRPPNGTLNAIRELSAWKGRKAAQRQRILDGDTLEVDDTGTIILPRDLEGLEAAQMRNRWWGEVHSDSYGPLLADLHLNLNNTFTRAIFGGKPTPSYHWDKVMKYDRAKWNAADMPALTEAELEKFARYQYPVYARGYNWIQSNERSAERLKGRILEIIKFWSDRKFDCKQVILVTHSMGGLVGRACAKQIPELIVGVVHGVMPALGAPLAYRRIACGTERSAPGAGKLARIQMEGFSDIAGSTPDHTTPVMATASGALELLPNHLYPSPWLFASVKKPDGTVVDVTHLQPDNIYDFYRNYDVWFRVIDPGLADPSGKYKEAKDGVKSAVDRAVKQAEKFHTKILDTYYHPNTYAYYGADEEKRSFGVFRWVTEEQQALTEPLNKILPVGTGGEAIFNGDRYIFMPEVFKSPVHSIHFAPGEQNTSGDGTVPQQSGDGPRGKVRRIFRTTGFDHQGSYANEHMLKLTHHLICKIVQEAK
jgi:pimeloyl-ACP methyl ester carboxylesterase